MDIMPFIRYSGDRERAETLRRFALTQLKITEDLMKYRDIKQYKRRITLPGGIVITCRVQFGLPMVEIHVPPMIPEMPPEPLLPYDFSIIPYWHDMSLASDPVRTAHFIRVTHFGFEKTGAPEVKRKKIMNSYWEFEEGDYLSPIKKIGESQYEFLTGTNLGALGGFTWNYEGNDLVGHSFTIYHWQNHKVFFDADTIEDDYADVYRSGVALYKDGESQLVLNGLASGFWIAPDDHASPGSFRLFTLQLRYYGYEACSDVPGGHDACQRLTLEWYSFTADGTPDDSGWITQGYNGDHGFEDPINCPDRSWIHPWNIIYDPDLDLFVTDCASFGGDFPDSPEFSVLVKAGWVYKDYYGDHDYGTETLGVPPYACAFDPISKQNVLKYFGTPYNPQVNDNYYWEDIPTWPYTRLVGGSASISYPTSGERVLNGSISFNNDTDEYTYSNALLRFDARIICYYDYTKKSNKWRIVDCLWVIDGTYTIGTYDLSGITLTVMLADQDGDTLTTFSLNGADAALSESEVVAAIQASPFDYETLTIFQSLARRPYVRDMAFLPAGSEILNEEIYQKLRDICSFGAYVPDKTKPQTYVSYTQTYKTRDDDHENATFEAHVEAVVDGEVKANIQLGAMPKQQWRWVTNARGINLLPNWQPEAEE